MAVAYQQNRAAQQQRQVAPQFNISIDQYPVISDMADRFGVSKADIVPILKSTAFKVKGGNQPTDAQIAALMVVAGQYKLNPFTKEIFAFPDKHGGIVPVVSVDGWARIINEHPAMDGLEFRSSETIVTMEAGKPSPEWIEGVIYRKDRSRPIVVREYLDETYQPPRSGRNDDGKPYTITGPWQTHTKRFLRHKALIQTARLAFGFAGIYDEDEADRIIESRGGEPAATASMQPREERAAVFDGEFSQVLDEAEAAASSSSHDEPKEAENVATPPDSQIHGFPKEVAAILASRIKSAGLTIEAVESGFGEPLTPKVINKIFAWIEKNRAK